MEWLLAVALKPFVALILFGAAIIPVMLFKKYFPEGKIKRLLLYSWGDSQDPTPK